MLKQVRALGVLVTAAVVMAGCSSGASGLAAFTGAASDTLAAHEATSTAREFDAMGGSGTAGIDPDEAREITEEEFAELTGDISFSVPSGTFQGQVSVGLSTSVADAQIRYTTDGSVPSASSTLYSGSPLVLTSTTQVRAQAFVNGTATGALGTGMYVARSINATHDLPLVVMDAYGGGKPNKTAYKDVSVMVMEPTNGSVSLASTPTVATRGGFHLRGQSSSSFEKAPYRLELWDNLNKDADYPLVGMPADSDWVLRGPFPDKSLIRDALAYSLARDMGLQAPRYAFVELYLNLDRQPMASNDYQGVYLLVENIKRSKDRVDIAKLKKTDLSEPAISGGYILQLNMMAAEPPTLACSGSNCWRDLEVVEPEELQAQQKTWIQNYVQQFHNALHGSNPSNPQTGYPAYIDVDSWVNRIIHNELAREGDSYMRSTHFYKDRGGKLVAGPVWDYDLGYNAIPMGSSVQGWQYQGMMGGMPGMGGGAADWFTRLMADQAFLSKVKSRWQALRRDELSDAQLTAKINALSTGLANASRRNFQRWPNLNTAMVGMFQTQATQTWEQQVQVVRNFVTQRAGWLSSNSAWGGTVIDPPTTRPPTTRPPTTGPPTTRPPTGRGCTATYAITNQWNTGFQADIKVTAGSSAITGWTVSWTFTDGQTIQSGWNVTLTSSGSSVTARSVQHNGSLGAGASTSFGFTGNHNGTNTAPAVTCTAS